MEIKNFEQSVLRALSYFDIFSHSLTARELYKNLYGLDKKIGYYDFLRGLESVKLEKKIEEENGYYFLPGRKEIVYERDKRIRDIEEKIKIGCRGISLLRFAPFVEAVFVCNTVASGTADKDSDIDVFIVVREGRLWLARFFATVILGITGLRRNKKKIKNRLCLSFYATDADLNLEKISINGNDIYLAYWLAQLIPIYDPFSILKRIVKENEWVNKIIPHFGEVSEVDNSWSIKKLKKLGSVVHFCEKIWGGGYGDVLEEQARAIQLAKMRLNKESLRYAADTRVVVNDQMLKFHENDRREEYRTKWLKRCLVYGCIEEN